jgi:hypothetical protein
MVSIVDARADLTPRSRTKLEQLARHNRIAYLLDGQTLAGWALIEELLPGLSELGMAFIKPEYRGASAFHALCRLLSTQDERLVLATYDDALISYAKRVWHWQEKSLWQVALMSRGRFITKRLDRSSRSSIQSRMQTKKPRFVYSGGKTNV